MKSKQQAACEAALALCQSGNATAEELRSLQERLQAAVGPKSIHVTWDGKQVELTDTGNGDQWSSSCCLYFMYRRDKGWHATESFSGDGEDPQSAVDELEANLRKRVGQEG